MRESHYHDNAGEWIGFNQTNSNMRNYNNRFFYYTCHNYNGYSDH